MGSPKTDAVVRGGAAVLAAFNLWWGLWAYLWPAHFFATFPGLGHAWTAAYPPYNEHLVVDLGATFLTLAGLLGVAALTRDRRVCRVALGAVVLFNGLHLGFHATRMGTMASPDYAASLVTLVVGVMAPLVLIVLPVRPAPSPSS